MEYRRLGNSGLKVSVLTLGTMTFGGEGDFKTIGDTDLAGARRQIAMCLDAGVNLIDTADMYSGGRSEEIIGEALQGRRDEVLIASKVRFPMGEDPNLAGLSRHHIIAGCEASLRRLRTDWIDLYQVHRPDPTCDVDETLGALTDLVRAGKVRYLGSSTFPADQIVESQWTSQRRGREQFVCEQPPYSIFARAIEADVLPACLRYGMGVVAWSPLNRGWLTGKYRKDAAVPEGSRATRQAQFFEGAENERKLELVEELLKIASDAGCSLTHLAQAWVVRHPAVTSAIIGPRTMDQLDDLLAGQDVTLDDAALDRIDEVVPPGTTINPADNGFTPPALRDPVSRRRPAAAVEASSEW